MPRYPLGLADVRLPHGGTAPYSGANRPGPLGTREPRPEVDAAFGTARGTVPTDLSGITPVWFVVGSETYRLCRTDAQWRRRPEEVDVPPDRAAGILERAIALQPENSPLLALFRTAAAGLVGLQKNGVFVVLWQRPQPQERAPVPPPPPPPRQRVAASSSSPAPQPAVADAQAAALKQAAQSGAPFCEECARAAAAGA